MRVFATIILCGAAALSLCSCRAAQKREIPFVEPPLAASGADISVSASFLRPEDKAPGLFKELLPDSGIVAVRVALRNDGARALVIHSANGMELGPGFKGISLIVDGTEYLPVSPRAIVEMLVGAKKTTRYRKTGIGGVVAGMAVPPLGGYYIYSEISVGRYYRPLYKHSLYPARESGMFAPLRLEPGEERSGYLYFALPAKFRGASCELFVNACVPIETRFALAGRDFRFSRDEVLFDSSVPHYEREKGSTGSCESPYGYIYSLGGDESSGKSGLYFCRVSRLTPGADSLWSLLAPIASKSAVIADVSCRGSLAACAVNFKSKSKLFLMRCADEPEVYEEQSFSRKIDHVFLFSGGALVVTEDDFCHYYNGSSGRWGLTMKLGQDIDDTALLHEHLFAFARKEVRVLDASSLSPLVRKKGGPLRSGERRVVGLLDGKLLLLNGGSSHRSDTLVLFDIDEKSEICRGSLVGKVNQASTVGSSLLVQLEEGTLLRIQPGPLGVFTIAESAHLPFAARALKAAPHGFMAVGGDGVFAVGSLGDFSPGTGGALEVSTMVR